MVHETNQGSRPTKVGIRHGSNELVHEVRPEVQGEPVLTASNLSVALGGVKPLWSSISLTLRPGEIVAVLGPSGCGKTTLLDCLGGALIPAWGQVEWASPRRARIHQDLRLVGERSALANVLHGSFARSKGLFRFRFSAEEKGKALALLDELGIKHKAALPVKLLSLGEQQRVAVARALMAEPDVLLADEPVSSLDKETAERIFFALERRACEEGLAVLCVLHQPELANRYGHRVLRLTAGRLEDITPGPSAPYSLQ
jgi:phosphonate transport system ATP-binding protein